MQICGEYQNPSPRIILVTTSKKFGKACMLRLLAASPRAGGLSFPDGGRSLGPGSDGPEGRTILRCNVAIDPKTA